MRDSDEYTRERYGANSVYLLRYQEGSGDSGIYISCVFAKINGSWKIINFEAIG